MGLFDMFGGKSSAPQYNPEIAKLDPALMAQLQTDIGGVRNLSTAPISGLSQAGIAQQDLARQAYGSQLDQFNRQQGSGLATAQAGLGRFGADSGSAERVATQNMRQGLIGQQQLGAANMQNLANVAQQDLGTQQQQQYSALMALPQLSQGVMGTQYNADLQAANAANRANVANMASQQEAGNAFSNMLGTAGGIIGGIYGGPLGAAGWQAGGQMLGGLFS